jgi:hypothetical protein
MLRFPVLAVQPYGYIVGALALNYCKNCRRHLNGAVSCPGCGATGLELSNAQDARSTLRMPPVDPDTDATRDMSAPKSAGGGRRGIPVGEDGDARDGGRRSRAAAAEARRSRAERRGEKRHGIGLMLTGGFAGIIVVAFLLYGNAGGGSDGAPAGNVVAVGRTGTSTAGAADLAVTISPTGPASSEEPTSASASPTHSASASPSPTKSSTPEQTTTSAAPGRSATATATRTTASAPPTTASASPTANPTPSSTRSSCWLIFC